MVARLVGTVGMVGMVAVLVAMVGTVAGRKRYTVPFLSIKVNSIKDLVIQCTA